MLFTKSITVRLIKKNDVRTNYLSLTFAEEIWTFIVCTQRNNTGYF